MYLERLLQINMATMAALGTMLLGMGQRDPTAPLLMLIAAITSVWLTDFTGWFQLNRTVATLAMVGALLISMRDLPSIQAMTQLYFLARLVVYFQVILLFHKKDARAYWPLATVSLLQVVVASAFNQGVWFGVLLVVYLMVGLSALALFFLHRERLRYQPGPLPAKPRPAGGARWPLAGQPSAFCGSATPARGGPGRELYRRLGAMGVATLLLTVLLFFTVPRIGSTAWRGATATQRHAVGFSDRVTLGELGQIIQNPEEVMRARFSDLDGNLYRVRGDDPDGQYRAGVYLRGAVLNDYRSEYQHGYCTASWSCAPLPAAQHELLSHEGLVRQQITIEPMDRQELFCVWPFSKTEPGGELLFDPQRQRLLRPRERCWQRFSYELKTPAFDRGLLEAGDAPPAELVQAETTPADETVDLRQLLQMPTREEGRSAVPALEKLAEQWIAESGLPPEDRAGRARTLEKGLRDSGRFQYSLHRQPPDSTIDPVEDFITNNPRGHCEYFATALALMLRSQGIPSRVVVGYHCDEFNNVGRFYQVRQLHAHAWVEAYLSAGPGPDEPAPAGQHGEPARGDWLRLDATPGGPGERASAGSSWLARTGRSLNSWLQSLWSNYVMEMDRSRQQEAIYQPLLDSIKEAARRLSDPAWWRDTLTGIGQGIWQFILDWIGGDWLSWRGLSALLIFGLILVAVGRGVLFLLRRWLRRLAAGADEAGRAQRARVEFYRRLEAMLARQGLVRSASQTQHEFALAAGVTIAQATGRGHLAALPVRVADAFYHVRFGGATLDNRQSQGVEQALAELEQAAGKKG